MASEPERLLSAAEVAERTDKLAIQIADIIDDEWVVVCLLTGALWFAADLTRALARRGRQPLFDALWLASYGDAQASSGIVQIRSPLQRPVAGRGVLILDEVLDTGMSLEAAKQIALQAGAREVLTCVFCRKPSTRAERATPDFIGWEAPGRFLVGYGMDVGGRYRGLPDIVAFD